MTGGRIQRDSSGEMMARSNAIGELVRVSNAIGKCRCPVEETKKTACWTGATRGAREDEAGGSDGG